MVWSGFSPSGFQQFSVAPSGFEWFWGQFSAVLSVVWAVERPQATGSFFGAPEPLRKLELALCLKSRAAKKHVWVFGPETKKKRTTRGFASGCHFTPFGARQNTLNNWRFCWVSLKTPRCKRYPRKKKTYASVPKPSRRHPLLSAGTPTEMRSLETHWMLKDQGA